MIENKRYDVFTELLHTGIGITDNGKELTGDDVIRLLNKQEEQITSLKSTNMELEKELKNRKKMNNILEGFLLDKGYDFNDIIKFLQDRTEKGEEEWLKRTLR